MTVGSTHLHSKVDFSGTKDRHLQLTQFAQLKRYAYIPSNLTLSPVEKLQLIQILRAESFYIYVMKNDYSNVRHLLQDCTL